MERGSKHGFRIDDAMADETESLVRSGHESRVSEHLEMEPNGEDQPIADSRLNGQRNMADDPYPEVSTDELELRSEIAKHLRASAWPANRQRLEDIATEEQAPANILAQLRQLPDGVEFDNVQDVWHALGHTGETTRF
jgi:hypothetical protein